ncbi:MAG: hypothetical protein GQ535_16905 [Rhodobacteraceae bacterium]|nr:hypothetical protein [Paracoccaceae bacterium]
MEVVTQKSVEDHWRKRFHMNFGFGARVGILFKKRCSVENPDFPPHLLERDYGSMPTIIYWIAGYIRPSFAEVQEFARAMGVTLEWLVFGHPFPMVAQGNNQ